MDDPLLEVLIPTYNRAANLGRNIDALGAEISSARLEGRVRILISDNHSTDETSEAVSSARLRNPTVDVAYSRRPHNIGLEENALTLLRLSRAPYIMWLGDDDYLAPGYLAFVVDSLSRDPHIGAVLAGLTELRADGTQVHGRREDFDVIRIPAGYDGVWGYSHLAHQMSGIALRREGLLEDYLSHPEYRNPYLFIHLLARTMLTYDSVYAPQYRTQVTVFNQKHWGYNDVGLLDEVYKSYYGFRGDVGEERLRDLLIRFTVVHSYRFGFEPLRFVRPLKQYLSLRRSVDVAGFERALAVLMLKDIVLVNVRFQPASLFRRWL